MARATHSAHRERHRRVRAGRLVYRSRRSDDLGFGGGTLDVTVLRIHHGIFEEVASKGIGKLGGDDVDAALGKVIAERFQEKSGSGRLTYFSRSARAGTIATCWRARSPTRPAC